jgi:uncharacterized membrane protein
MTGKDDPSSPRRGAVVIDLLVVAGIASVAALLAYRPSEPLAPLRVLLGLVAVLFAPGYATLVALLPVPTEASESDPSEWVVLSRTWGEELPRWTAAGLGRLERAVLAVLISLVVVPVLGLLLSLASVRIGPDTVVPTVAGYTVLFAAVAAVRRSLSAGGGRSQPFGRFRAWLARVGSPPTRLDALLNLSLVFLVVIGGAAVVAPMGGEEPPAFTEFSLLAENGSDGPVMRGYLSGTGPNETAVIRAGITNREHRRLNYTVVVQVQRATVAERSVRVLDRRRASVSSVELDHDESAGLPYEFTVSAAETGCRVVFLLYTDGVPRSPTAENAYRELHLWHAADPPGGGSNCPTLDAVDVRVDRRAASVRPAGSDTSPTETRY